jgi:hypothetical protein
MSGDLEFGLKGIYMARRFGLLDIGNDVFWDCR